MKKVIPVIGLLTSITVVFFLLLLSIRILLSPIFLELEYRMPGFPADTYGFTTEERLEWAKVSVSYLLSDEGIDYLENQALPDGSPLYNERELGHMYDVQVLVQRALISWYVTIALLILFGLFSTEYKFKSDFWTAFSRGGLWAICLVVVVLFGVLISFDAIFTSFHKVFFVGDSWLFNYSDSLIRLFPIRFWQDAFIFLGFLTALGGVFVFFIGRRVSQRGKMEKN